LIEFHAIILEGTAQRFALAAGGRDEIRFESRKNPKRRKMSVSRNESHQSAARFVGMLLTCKTHCLKKNTTAELLKLWHEPLTLATTKKLTCKTLAIQRTFTEQNL
jgi:hypothetical protein